MQGIYYLLSIATVLIVFIWYIRNDGLAEGEPTRGLLAMKEPIPPHRTHQLAHRATKARSSSASIGRSVAVKRNPAQSHLHPRAHGR
jgi:hypothetical protein